MRTFVSAVVAWTFLLFFSIAVLGDGRSAAMLVVVSDAPGGRGCCSGSSCCHRDKRGGASMKILVVDDEPELLETVASLLTYEGHDVRLARDGGEAFEILVREDFDVLLTDLQMPRMSGLKLAVAVRRLEGENHLRAMGIIVMTADDTVDNRQALTLAGANAVLGKPFSREVLRTAIESVSTPPVCRGS